MPEIEATGNITTDSVRTIKLDNMGRVSTKDAEHFLGYTDRTLRNWREEGCPAIFEGGAVDVAGVIAWRENKLVTEAEQDKADIIEATGGLTLQQVQVRHEIAKTRMTEIKLAEALGLLIPRDVYIHALSTLMSDIDGRLNSLPKDVAPLVSVESNREECERLTKGKVDDMRAMLMVDVAMNLKRNEVDPFEEADRETDEQEREDADG